MFGGWNGGGMPWSDGSGNGNNWTGGGGGANGNGDGGNNGGPNDPSWGWGNGSNGVAVPTTVVQMCPYSIMQGFLDAGTFYRPYVAGANMGNLSGRNVVSSGGHYLDLVAPAQPRGIYIPRFGIDISALNNDINNPNAMIGNIEQLSVEIAQAYQYALRNWINGTTVSTTPASTFSLGLDFLNEWKAVFNQSHPNNYMEIIFNGYPGVQVRDATGGDCIR
jgi:hypothetical protein